MDSKTANELISVLKGLAGIIADVEIGNCSDIAADKLADGLHAVAESIDTLTDVLRRQ